jgi:nucleoside-diphosphate-sugar epimerase
MPFYLENRGIATRDFIYVRDICRGLVLCALKGKAGDVYNLGTNRETSIKELAQLILKFTDSKSKIEYLPPRTWDTSGRRYASIEKAKNELGFYPQIPLENGLELTIKWTKENLEIIDQCISKHSNKVL